MKPLYALTACCMILLLSACSKEKELRSGKELLGKWVDINYTADTLVFTNRDGKLILFDNSLAYRSWLATVLMMEGGESNANHFEVRLKEGKMATRPLDINMPDVVGFFEANFEWMNGRQEFSVEPNGFRPHLSCMGCPQRFRKID